MKRILQNIRTRLTVWNILVFGGILGLYAIGTSWFFLATLSKQLDASLKEELELIDQMLFHLPAGEYLIDTHEEDAMQLERFIELWSPDAHLLYRSKMLGSRTLGPPPDSSEFNGFMRSIVLEDGTRLRVASKLHSSSTPVTLIRLSVNEDEYLGGVHRFMDLLLFAVPIGLLLISISGYLLARNALKPIDAMVSTAQRITAEALHERIPVGNPDDELGRLARTFNDLLERVERSFLQLRRFTSDASHQLRTPLTAIRTVGEVGLQGSHTVDEFKEVVGSMLEEIGRLTHLVESLLFLSRADAGKHTILRKEIDALEMVHEIGNTMRVLAEEKNQQLEITGRQVTIYGDPTILGQALLNVIDNAIKFSPEGAAIHVSVTHEVGSCRVSIRNDGPAIPDDQQHRIFERFYSSTRNETSGAGLGLPIAQWAVETHGGSLCLESSDLTGTTFVIQLPLWGNLKQS